MKPNPIIKFLYSAMTLKSGYNRLSDTKLIINLENIFDKFVQNFFIK